MVSRLARFQHAFVRRLSELGITYRGSPIVEGPGKRYFDDSMRDGKGILSRFLLVLDSDAEPSTTEAAKQLVGSFSDVVELRVARQQGIRLSGPMVTSHTPRSAAMASQHWEICVRFRGAKQT
jgi:hypothetical protein